MGVLIMINQVNVNWLSKNHITYIYTYEIYPSLKEYLNLRNVKEEISNTVQTRSLKLKSYPVWST